MTAHPNRRTWIDHARKIIFDTSDGTHPPGCVPFTDAVVPNGYARHTSRVMMDGATSVYLKDNGMTDAQRAIARAGIDAATADARKRGLTGDASRTATFDAAGSIPLLDGGLLSDALSAVPAEYGWKCEKIARDLIDATSAARQPINGRDTHFGDAVRRLRDHVDGLRSTADYEIEAAKKAAYAKAGQTLASTIDGMESARTGQHVDRATPQTQQQAYDAMRAGLSNAWKGSRA